MSQSEMAKELGVSKATVQNWESGTSCPSQLKGFEWFQALGKQPMPYYLRLLYPQYDDVPFKDMSDEQVDQALWEFTKIMPTTAKRKILYIMTGNHGSSPLSILEMIIAHLHSPLGTRVNIAQSILFFYEMAEIAGQAVEDGIKPDLVQLRRAIYSGMQAVRNGDSEYQSILKDIRNE